MFSSIDSLVLSKCSAEQSLNTFFKLYLLQFIQLLFISYGMIRYLQSEKLKKETNPPSSSKLCTHWLKAFGGFIKKRKAKEVVFKTKLKLTINK